MKRINAKIMEHQINQTEQTLLAILYDEGNPVELTLNRVLSRQDKNGESRLKSFKGSQIQYAKKNLINLGLIDVTEAPKRHDFEEGEGLTRVDDDVTFYYFDLDKKLKLSPKGELWCKRHLGNLSEHS
jgi:hypothetical protein